MKRRIREAVIKIHSETNLKNLSIVIIYKSRNIISFKEIIKDLSFIFEKL